MFEGALFPRLKFNNHRTVACTLSSKEAETRNYRAAFYGRVGSNQAVQLHHDFFRAVLRRARRQVDARHQRSGVFVRHETGRRDFHKEEEEHDAKHYQTERQPRTLNEVDDVLLVFLEQDIVPCVEPSVEAPYQAYFFVLFL